jgi:hypothetical protein
VARALGEMTFGGRTFYVKWWGGRLVKNGPVDERCVVYVYPTYIYKMHLQVPTVLVSQHCHK